jgi:chromosome segregation ATPase
LQGRLDSADSTIMAVGKRVVSLNASIGTLKEMETVLEKFSERQAKQDKALEKMLPQMETGMAEVRKAVADLAEKSAKPAPKAEADPRIAALQSQLKVLEPQLQAQARATAKLAEQVTAMQTNLAKINGVSRDVETLLKMEKQRVVVAPPPPAPAPAPVAAAVVEKEKTPPAPNYVRFPNPNAREAGKGKVITSSPAATPAP